MTDRIDRYLDGGIDRIALTPEERDEADLVERVVDETRAFVDARPAPDVTAAVMRTIEQLAPRPAERPRSVLARVVGSLWIAREVSFEFRPAYALLAAAVVALAVLMPFGGPSPVGAPPMASVGTAPRLFVQFHLQAANASTVRLAGSFTNWQPQYELHQSAPGVWTVTLPLPLGVHDYAFVVDGQQWVPDPYAQSVDDGFGGTNSRIALLPPDEPRL